MYVARWLRYGCYSDADDVLPAGKTLVRELKPTCSRCVEILPVEWNTWPENRLSTGWLSLIHTVYGALFIASMIYFRTSLLETCCWTVQTRVRCVLCWLTLHRKFYVFWPSRCRLGTSVSLEIWSIAITTSLEEEGFQFDGLHRRYWVHWRANSAE